MASICKEILIEARPEDVWAAVRDFGAVHQRLVPGILVDARLEGDGRVVTFASGAVARELLVDVDDEARRLAYAVVEGRLGITHHNSSIQVFADGEDRSRLVWITDVLPHDLATPVRDLVEQGASVMKQTLEVQASRG
ncbi:MAG: SRPBCC family protein [Chloroflexi bacterium]|nr:SRPBCC family protein [Chloroflexota bacterium]